MVLKYIISNVQKSYNWQEWKESNRRFNTKMAKVYGT